MANKKKFTILLLMLLALCLSAIFILYNLNKQLSNKKNQVSQNLNTNKIIAAFDKPFYIELSMNPSTGFQWQANFDTQVLKLNKTDFVQPGNTEKVGAEEIQRFEFQALEKVNTSITFRYLRPWEVDTPPAETKTYDITLQ
jgi:predicted secreted protein